MGPELYFVNVILSMCGPKLKVGVFKISSPRTAVPVREIILTIFSRVLLPPNLGFTISMFDGDFYQYELTEFHEALHYK